MIYPSLQPSPPPSESVFAYGPDTTAVSALAVGLALQRCGAFAWADCSIPSSGSSEGPKEWLERGHTRAVGDGVDESDLIARSWSWAALGRLLVPESRMDSLHLMCYLTLPNLIQELAALSTAPGGESSVLLANVDALEHGLRRAVLADAQVHFRLREASVALFVTSRDRPTRKERVLFDRVFHVEVPPGASWIKGVVSIEDGSEGSSGPIPLRNAWRALGLDLTLLPPT
jgi:hypothetical protein